MPVRSAASVTTAIVTTFVAMLLFASPVLAFDETTSTMPVADAAHCEGCHSPWPDATQGGDPYGVHAGYTTTTFKCQSCHSVHAADPAGSVLLPGATITDDCNTCHDGTGGQGVYGVVKARLNVDPASGHRTETTTTVPGGDIATGGGSDMSFAGRGGTLTCTDCHSPHGAGTVAAFPSGRRRAGASITAYVSSKLLKQRPGNATETVTEYGSDWCLGCHRGRSSTGVVHNHPAETTATAAPSTAYVYRNAPILASDLVTNSTVLGQLGATNKGFLMPYPRTTGDGGQSGHFPLCQQCHADPRYPGVLNADGTAQAATYITTAPTFGQPDGGTATDNPLFQTFPHEATSTAMLVQQNDALCLDCHPPGQLP
jgi:hypothetical protein